MIISLTGFMGCGKSSVGVALQTLLCCNIIDLDTYIENKAGMSITEIFKTLGEPAFRKMEPECLKEIVAATPKDETLILSLGGGTIMTPECAQIVRENTVCIYLEATIDTLVENLKGNEAQRPMLSGSTDLRARVEDLMNKRADTYKATAHHIVNVDNATFDESAEEIAELLK